jgi:putative protein-disulfide isomerase
MATESSASLRLTLVYDPLCGWCYGATPSVRRLSQHAALSLQLLPSGLFAGSGVRPLDESFAAHAWSSDQRIARLSGQPFSPQYRQRVLGDRSARLDSGPAVLALTAVNALAPDQELRALEAIQTARYVQGRDTTDVAVLAQLLRDLGLAAAASQVEANSSQLRDAAASRMNAGKALLRSLGVTGVPTLVAPDGSGLQVIPSQLLYGRIDELLRHLGVEAPGYQRKVQKENEA